MAFNLHFLKNFGQVRVRRYVHSRACSSLRRAEKIDMIEMVWNGKDLWNGKVRKYLNKNAYQFDLNFPVSLTTKRENISGLH